MGEIDLPDLLSKIVPSSISKFCIWLVTVGCVRYSLCAAFEKLFNFYNVSTIKELSQKVGIGASTISAWNQRKSISALK